MSGVHLSSLSRPLHGAAGPRSGRWPRRLLSPFAILGAISYGHAQAETLQDAISLAYETSPAIQANRAQLRALDESYVAARAGLRPTVSLQASAGYDNGPQSSIFGGNVQVQSNAGRAVLDISQPIFTGGRISAEIDAAKGDVLAGREALRQLEATVLQATITAYCDVLRDQQLLAVQQEDEATLDHELDDARIRLTAGEITRTDVAQLETQLAQSRSALFTARARLNIHRSDYVATVGREPGTLVAPTAFSGVPATVDEALDLAERQSPLLGQARMKEQASRARITEARAAFRPTVTLDVNVGYTPEIVPYYTNHYAKSAAATITVTQLLFAGGRNASTVRKALDLNNSDQIGVEVARRNMVQGVSQAWEQISVSRQVLSSDRERLKSAQTYASDMKEEYAVGQRSVLDILVAEQGLLTARQALANDEHDLIVGQAALLSAVGRLEARYVIPETAAYNPATDPRRPLWSGQVPWDPILSTLDNLGSSSPRVPFLSSAGDRGRGEDRANPIPVTSSSRQAPNASSPSSPMERAP